MKKNKIVKISVFTILMMCFSMTILATELKYKIKIVELINGIQKPVKEAQIWATSTNTSLVTIPGNVDITNDEGIGYITAKLVETSQTGTVIITVNAKKNDKNSAYIITLYIFPENRYISDPAANDTPIVIILSGSNTTKNDKTDFYNFINKLFIKRE